QAFYLQAMATLPSVRNGVEIQNHLLELVRARAVAAGFEFFSSLIEEQTRATGPAWLKEATVLRTIPNYLRSGVTFVYAQAPIAGAGAPVTGRDPL
ncbi:MAG TPA: hypothetical protein VHF22_12995, partial [Planctomycetota bacterium]|nr:hypothetical protein [Planctomycetota bacterium]